MHSTILYDLFRNCNNDMGLRCATMTPILFSQNPHTTHLNSPPPTPTEPTPLPLNPLNSKTSSLQCKS